MFDSIAGRYDFMNHFLSFGIDRCWRKKAIRELARSHPKDILDIATGTGDFAISALKADPEKIVGIDFSKEMLREGRKKIMAKNLQHLIFLEEGDAENLSFHDNSFDAVTVAFGVRNFEHLEKGLKEMARVLRPAQPAIILEFSNPTVFPVKQLYHFYFKYLVPFYGRLFSKDKTAYRYLFESAVAFPSGKKFCDILESCGFTNVRVIPVSFKIATIYIGLKGT
jgi:demethylmenaquinone methyltransferase / 2-methoxy-6-polyprenyl-1,4-benzoquinol methylase